MEKDISFIFDDKRLNIRVAAFITYGDNVLLQTDPSVDFYFLPGGRVKLCESSLDAIKREVKEELNFIPENPKLFYFVENFFNMDNMKFHELMYVYHIEVSELDAQKLENANILDKTTSKVSWVHKDKYKTLNCKPKTVLELFDADKTYLTHVINVD